MNGFPHDDIDGEETELHYVISDVQQVIQFINNELINSLSGEPQDLLIKFGGRKKLASVINGNEDFIGEIGLDDDEYYSDDKKTLINISNRIKDILQYALNHSATLNVDVY